MTRSNDVAWSELDEIDSPGGGEVEYIGVCDAAEAGRVRGWALGRTSSGRLVPCAVTAVTAEGRYTARADAFRADIAGVFGVEFGGFEVRVPEGDTGGVLMLTIADRHMLALPNAAGGDHHSDGRGHVDGFETGVLRGWATTASGKPARVQLLADGKQVGTACASAYRADLVGEGVPDGLGGFRMRPPLGTGRKGPVRFTVAVDGNVIGDRTVRLPPQRALIVSETENLDDASRRFRCDHLRHHFGNEGFDARVIGPDEFRRKEWVGYDVIVFARCGADADLFEKVARYKSAYRTRIVYEIDDLVFLPWHTHDLGSVRSRVDDPNNPGLKEMFARRLRLVTLADAAITTTATIAERLAAMGLPVLELPNMVPEHEIAVSPRPGRAADAPLRLLCMAGSQTHYRDFELIEGVLESLCRDHRERVRLTLLGKFKDSLPLARLANVRMVERLPYEDMLHTIDEHDLCLVPLERTEFNDAKSCLKFIECGARGVPVLASATRDYRRVIEHGVNGFATDSLRDWRSIMEQALASEVDLTAMGKAAKEAVRRNFTIETSATKPGAWLQEVFANA